MKKFFLTLTLILSVIFLSAQPPKEQRRPLPNQFRDFVDFQQRPKIEKKDGMVIITMSEEQFNRMRQMRMNERFQHTRFQMEKPCEKCMNHHPKHIKKRNR